MENFNQQQLYTTNLLPVVPLRGKVAFPNVALSFEVGRAVTVKAIERASATDKTILILAQCDVQKTDILPEDLYTVGCVAKIKTVAQLTSGVRVLCEILYRAQARAVRLEEGMFSAVCDPLYEIHGDEVMEEASFRAAKALMKDVAMTDGKIGKETLARLDACQTPDEYINVAVSAMRVRLDVKQAILEETRTIERLRAFERCLNDELEISKIEKKIATAVRQSIDKNQKEYFLREQMKAIQAELGEDGKEEDEYRAKILEKRLPQDLETKCLKEVDRLAKMPSSSAEYTVISGYLDQVLSLPWTEETQDTDSLADCVKVLESDHYGLEKIKERITEYLAVLKLTRSMKAPILCFVGPPGVGKTSIAKSIANALGRKFVRMSLGGVKDEAEIRGHRRTYIGAMPGRILYGMKNAGSINPVFLLDEIDKITADMHGDPASALLEVLDPEQNSTFRDRYLEFPYDLSKVLFITTANSLETIPAPLRDRMEIIQLSGYTLEEKTEIAKRYLIPKQLSANGLTEKNAAFTDDGVFAVIDGYTREAGVRTLERTLGTVCRKIAVQYADNSRMRAVRVDKKKAQELLGSPKFIADEDRFNAEIGTVTGLAWTAVGGTALTVECVTMDGKGELKLTGQLGDVMKESALASLSYIRSRAKEYGVDGEKLTKTDLHLHVPEGATPKDGPSAGVTMATAILSVLTGKKVRGDVAMTGEITLRGRVLPIGGLKEKALAARRLGIKTVIIPFANAREIAEFPAVLSQDVRFIPVKTVDEVFAIMLEGGKGYHSYRETPILEKTPTLKSRKKRQPKGEELPIITDEPQRDGVRCQ